MNAHGERLQATIGEGCAPNGAGRARASSWSAAGARRCVGALILAFGVVLPAFTLLFEVVTGLCAAIAFDPIPTIWHILLVACVPVANASAFVALRRDDPRHVRALTWLNSVAVGTSSCYTLTFLPLFPFAFMALAGFGVGFLPLTPAISLAVALVLRRKLRRFAAGSLNDALPGLWQGLSVAIGLLLLLQIPKMVTFAGAKLAIRETTRPTGVRLLRTWVADLLKRPLHVVVS